MAPAAAAAPPCEICWIGSAGKVERRAVPRHRPEATAVAEGAHRTKALFGAAPIENDASVVRKSLPAKTMLIAPLKQRTIDRAILC